MYIGILSFDATGSLRNAETGLRLVPRMPELKATENTKQGNRRSDRLPRHVLRLFLTKLKRGETGIDFSIGVTMLGAPRFKILPRLSAKIDRLSTNNERTPFPAIVAIYGSYLRLPAVPSSADTYMRCSESVLKRRFPNPLFFFLRRENFSSTSTFLTLPNSIRPPTPSTERTIETVAR